MSFINPIELLGLQDTPAEAIDSALLRRTRRKLQAEIELSDEGHIAYKGKKLSRSECEAAIAQLEITEKIEYFHLVARYPALSDFLTKGDPVVFEAFPKAAELRRTEFLAFISAVFATQYDKALWEALRTKNGKLFQRIITTPPLVKPEDMDAAFRQLVRVCKENISEVEKENKAIDREESRFDKDTAKEAAAWVKGKLNAKVFVLLPSALQGLRNAGAMAVRNFSVSVNNKLDDPIAALELNEYAQSMKPDGLTSQRLTEDNTAVKELAEAREETERLTPLLEKYGNFMSTVVQKIKTLENKTLSAAGLESWVNSNISVSELNELPVELQEVRNQVALALRGVSVAIWNTNYDVEVALRIIDKALRINAQDEAKGIIAAAWMQLTALKPSKPEAGLFSKPSINDLIRESKRNDALYNGDSNRSSNNRSGLGRSHKEPKTNWGWSIGVGLGVLFLLICLNMCN